MQTDAWKIEAWFAEQSLPCSARLAALLCIFPEYFGGHHPDGQASPWALQELRHRVSMTLGEERLLLCRLAESEYGRPLGFLSNMDTFCNQLCDGWPSFSSAERQLVHDGPLPKKCLCHSAHRSFKGLAQQNDVISSSTVLLGSSYWARIPPSIAKCIGHNSPRNGGVSASVKPIHGGLSRVFSMTTSSSSWSTLYHSWLAGNLTGLQLLEYAAPATVDEYLRGVAVVPLHSLAPLSFSSSPDASVPSSPAVLAPCTSASSSRVLSLKARSRTLVPLCLLWVVCVFFKCNPKLDQCTAHWSLSDTQVSVGMHARQYAADIADAWMRGRRQSDDEGRPLHRSWMPSA